jgi:hypothetical protein
MLGAAAIGTTPIPIVGDIVGAAADVAMFASDPTTRTLPNYAMSVAGVLPFVPGVSALRALRDAPSPNATEAAPPVLAPIDVGYRGSHTTPDADYGAPLNDLTQMMPENVYGPSGERLYGINNKAIDREVFSALRAARGKPDADVMIYRAVPKDVNAINPGDWVSTSKAYAKGHGESALGGDYRILEQKAKAGELYMAGDPQEFGWHPKETSAAPSPLEGTLDMSQAARMQRAAEQGFDVNTPVYHGSGTEFDAFDSGRLGENTGYGDASVGFHFSDNKADADFYASKAGERLGTKGVVRPFFLDLKNPLVVGLDEFDGNAGLRTQEFLDDKLAAKAFAEDNGHDGIIYPYGTNVDSGYTAIAFRPEQIRSTSAAFDPSKRGSANLMAGAAGATIGLSALRNIQRDEEPQRRPD